MYTFTKLKSMDGSSMSSGQHVPLLPDARVGSNTPLSNNNNRANLNGPSTLYQIITHETKKKTVEKGFDARQNFVHFAHGDLKNVITMQELMERPSVRNFLYRSRWYQRPQVLQLRSVMRGSAVSLCSFLSLLIALFCGDLCAFLSVPGNFTCDFVLTVAFGFFVCEFAMNAFSDRAYPLSFFFYMDLIGTFSMVFDISYMFGPDAMSIERLHTSSSSGGGVIVMRAARAARIGARAGRLRRVAKIVRFLSGSDSSDGSNNVRMAKVISNKLSDVLSIRVAFVVICVAVVLPSLSIFEYPEMEESLTAWTTFLAEDVSNYAKGARGPAETGQVHELLRDLSNFYSTANYGPFMICYRETLSAHLDSKELLACGETRETLKLDVDGRFSAPPRREFVLATSLGQMDLFFDLSEPKRLEALMGMSLIMFIILVMVAFSVILTENISNVALLPLERMLDVVRHRCAQIFRYTDALQEETHSDEEDEDDDQGEEEEDGEKSEEEDNEFALLEKAVAKLGAIAELSAQDPQTKTMWTENELTVHQWTNATQPTPKISSAVMELGRRLSFLAEDSDALEKLNEDVDSGLMADAETPDFDAFKLTPVQLKALSVRMLREYEHTKEYVHRSLKPAVLVNFVNVVEPMYLPNPFHNFCHAVDVLCWLCMEMDRIKAHHFLAESKMVSLMVAAIGHDLGHLGVNNQFLVATSHELAVVYNDKSPLENMHCWKLFQILGHEAPLFAAIDKEAYKLIRRDIIEVILHTDITKHNELVKDLSLFYQMNKDILNITELSIEAQEVLKANGSLMMNAFLHSADVNNPSRPWKMAEKLAHLCVDEFFAQGDKEKELEIPVGMLNDREMVNRAFSQIGFIEFMIAPWVEALVPMFPALEFMAEHTAENIQTWAMMWEKEVKPPAEQVEKVNLRVQKVVTKLLPQKSKAL